MGGSANFPRKSNPQECPTRALLLSRVCELAFYFLLSTAHYALSLSKEIEMEMAIIVLCVYVVFTIAIAIAIAI